MSEAARGAPTAAPALVVDDLRVTYRLAGGGLLPALRGVSFTVAPGETRFLLAQTTPNGGAQLLELSQEQGRKLARKGERLWTPEIYSEY